ncbi:MBG domain-containing protein, partial [Pseudoduganella ginsengisoli]
MNRCYRLRWSECGQVWVPVSEHARGRGKRGGVAGAVAVAAATAALMLPGAIAHAQPAPTQLPTGAQVAAGQAAVSSQGAHMDVQQGSSRAVIDWQTFNVGRGASVAFRQPDAASVMLNRVLDSQPSQIFGSITANGQVFLTNPNGIYFAPGASVDVGGLVATTHGISNDDFMAGRYRFTRGGSQGSVVNEGSLRAALGGYIALLAPEVRNRGVVIARQGTAVLAAGETFELQFEGAATLANVRVSAATIQALVDNGNAVRAPGGHVILSAHGANQVQGSVVHNSGVLEADALAERNGRIFLDGGAGSVSQEGAVAAAGGNVDVRAEDVYFGQGSTSVASPQGKGGGIAVNAGVMLGAVQGHSFDASGRDGGSVRLVAGPHADFTLSSTVTASGAGGLVQLSGGAMSLLSATVSADGGTVNLGGEWQGGGSLPHADTIKLNGATSVSARGGAISVWSDRGTAMEGALRAEGGKVEVSSSGALQAGGTIVAGSVLFDPKNITISSVTEPTKAGTVNLPSSPPYNTSSTDTRGFGESFALDGDHLAIGLKSYVATGSTCTSNCGAVYLYAGASSANWANLTFMTRISNPGTSSGALVGASGTPPVLGTGYADFGSAIALQNGHLAIGAPFYNNFQGGVYLFNYTSSFGTVTYAAKIDGATPVSGMPALPASGRFGTALAFAGSGDKLIVGSTGNAYLFDGLGTSPSSIGTIAYRNTLAVAAQALAANGDHLAIGSSNSVKLYDGLSSANYGSLALRNTITNATVPSGTPVVGSSDGFGASLALAGDLLYVGAPMSNNEGYGYGRVYVFNGMNSANMASPGYSSTIKDGAGGLTLGTNYNLGFAVAAATDRVVAGGQANVQLLMAPDPSIPAYTLTGATFAYADGGAGSSYVVTPADILGYLNAGTAVTLQANNDITVSSPIVASGSTTGGTLSLLAGRTLSVNQNITTNNGNLVLSSSTAGAISANTDAGQGQLLIPNTATINIGTGTATLKTDSININGSVTGTGIVNLQPATAGATVGLVGGAGTLSLFGPAIFNTARFNSTLSQLVIGGPNAGDITVGSSFTLNNTVPLTLSTPGSIFVTNATVNMGKPLILNADTDTSGGGRIAVTGSTISMNANNLVMGGGSCTAAGCTAPAVGVGGVAAIGVMNDHATITGSGGNLWVWGKGGSAGGDGVTYGFSNVNLGTAGGMTVRGDGSWTPSFTPGDGVAFGSGSIVRAGSGGINVTANGNSNTSTGSNGFAFYFDGGAKLYTTNGGPLSITVNMDQGNGGNAYMVCSTCLLGDAALQNGDISFTWGGTSLQAITMPNVAIPGSNTLTLTTPRGITAAGTTQSVGGNVTVNNGSAATSVALGTSGAFHAGGVTVNTAQNVTVIDTGATAVNGVSGVTGTVSVSAAGNLAVNGAIATASSAANAVTLVAGRGIAAGTAAGGDIVYNSGASVTYGAGGSATLYTGTANDSALTALAGAGSGRFRYYSTPTASNFSAALVAGTNIIARERPALAITGNSAAKTYDGQAYAGSLGATATGLASGDTLAMLSGSLNVAGTAFGAVNAGSYTVVPSGLTDTRGYAISYVNGALTVAQAPLSITAANASKTYNGLAFSGNNGVSYSGFVNGESVASLAGSLSFGGTAQGAVNAGSYTIVPQGLSSSNYAITYVDGVLAVAQAPLTVTAASAAKTYDGLAYSGGNGVSYTGFVNGETSAVLGGALGFGGSAQGAANAGSYAITPQGYTSTNYAISYASGALTVAQAPLTVTAANANKTYDGLAYSGGNGATYSGFVNGETSAVLGGTLGYGGTSQGAVNAGSYTIIPQGLSSTNYAIQYANGALAVDKAALTVTANNANKTYDGLAYSGGNGATYTGFANGETSAVLGGALAFGGSAQGAVNAGSYVITPHGYTSTNYTISYTGGALSVAQAPLTITANNAGKTYNGLAFSGGNGVAYSGFVHGESAASLTGSLSFGGTAQGAIDAGSYTIIPQGLSSTNYAVSYVNGALTVAQAPLTVTAANASKTYDGLAYSGGNGVSYTGFVNGETSAVLGGALAYGGTAQGAVNAGSYAITPQGYTSTNYAITYVDGALAIGQAPLTVAAANASRTYDGVAYSGGNGVSYTGFVNGETSAVLGGALAYGGTSQGAVNAGSYTIIPQGLSSTNYAIQYASGALTVDKAPLSLSLAGSVVKTYDGTDVASLGTQNYALTGVVAGQSVTVGKVAGTYDSAGAASGKTVSVALQAGDYIAGAGTSLSNYVLPTAASGNVGRIDPAPLTVTANDASRYYDGKPYSGGNGVTITGLAGSDTAASLGSVAYGGDSQGAVQSGKYAIVPSGFASPNYVISYVPGTLSISQALLTIRARDASQTYSGLPFSGGSGVTYSGFLNGDTAASLQGTLAYGGTSQGAVNAGSYSILPFGLSSANYTVVFEGGTLAIRPAALAVTANPAAKTYDGKAYAGGNGVSYSGFVNGETAAVLRGSLQYGGSSQGAVDAGSYVIKPSGLSSTNYTITYGDAALDVGKAALVVSAGSASKTYDGKAYTGGNGVSYSGFVNGEGATVLGGSLQYGGNSQGAVDAGSYVITPSGLSSRNYAITYQDGALEVGKAALAVSALDAGKTYDGKAYSGGNGVRYSGFVNGETEPVLGGSLQYGGSSQGAVNAGTYAIIPSGLASRNYSITYANGVLEVGKAALTVTAADAAKTYDAKPYAGGNGVRYSGFVNGETAAVLGGSLTYGGSAQGAVAAGTYFIMPQGLDSNNYTIAYQGGALTVARAPLTVTANADRMVYNGTIYVGGNGVVYAGFAGTDTESVLAGMLSYGGSSQGASTPGQYTIHPQGLSSANYDITYADGTLTILPAPPVINVPVPVAPLPLPVAPAAVATAAAAPADSGSGQAQQSSAGTADASPQPADISASASTQALPSGASAATAAPAQQAAADAGNSAVAQTAGATPGQPVNAGPVA